MNEYYELTNETKLTLCIEVLKDYRDTINNLINSVEITLALNNRIKKLIDKTEESNNETMEKEEILEMLDITSKVVENQNKTLNYITKLEEFNNKIPEFFNSLGLNSESG